MSTISVTIIGELNLDQIVTGVPHLPARDEEVIVEGMELTLGSSSAIFACQSAQLGDDVQFITKVGGDDFGQKAVEFLQAKGVPIDHVQVDESLSTGLTICIAIGTGRYQITNLGCIQEMRHGDVNLELLCGRQHLHISSFYLQRNLRPDIGRIFQKAHEMGLTTSLDPGFPDGPISDLDQVWPHVDVFLPNETEATKISGQESVNDALVVLAKRVPTAVIKLGPNGAIVQREDEVIRLGTFPVEVVDTTGAGDSFNAGFLHAHLEGKDLAECLDLGNACGALSTRAPGGTTSQANLQEAMELIRTSQHTAD